jgi:hypothetical protein
LFSLVVGVVTFTDRHERIGTRSWRDCKQWANTCPEQRTVGLLDGNVATMIISRTPLRISIGGGGTDLPSHYADAGAVLAART